MSISSDSRFCNKNDLAVKVFKVFVKTAEAVLGEKAASMRVAMANLIFSCKTKGLFSVSSPG